MAIDPNDLKKAGSTSKHKTKNNEEIVVNGANISVYLNSEDMSFLTRLSYKYPKKRSKIISLALAEMKKKYGDNLPAEELL